MSGELVKVADYQVLDIGKFKLGPTGLTMLPGQPPTYDEWAAVGELLRTLERGVQWMVGDWLNCGDSYFADKASQVIDHETWSPETVRVYRWTASKVPIENRRTDLSYSHHQLVAGMLPSEQKTWLDKAVTGDRTAEGDQEPWSSGRLKQELQAASPEGSNSISYLLVIHFESPADRDIVAQEHERIGRKCRKLESAKKQERAEL